MPFLLLILSPTLFSADWIHAEKGNITYLSNASLRKSKKITEQVEQFQAGMNQFVSVANGRKNWPLRIIICKDAQTFKKLAPERQKYTKDVAGIFTSGMAYDLILLRVDANSHQMKETVYHEMTHRLMRTAQQLPLWLDEGYAEFYSGFHLKSKKIQFGRRDIRHCKWLQYEKMTPLSRLFKVKHHSVEYNHPKFSRSLYATTWAFVHFCLLNEDPQIRSAFEQFIKESPKEITNEATFRKHFLMSYREMESLLYKYSRKFRHPVLEYTINEKFIGQNISFQEISNTHEHIYLWGTKVIHNHNPERLKSELLKWEKNITQNSSEYISLLNEKVQFLYNSGNYEQAQILSENSYELGSRNPMVLLTYAERLLQTMHGQRIWNSTNIPNKTVNLAMKCIQNVLDLDTNRAHAWNLYALSWIRSQNIPEYSHLQKLLSSCEILSNNKNLHLLTCDLLLRANRKHDAIELLERFTHQTNRQSDQKQIIERLKQLKR